MKRMNFPHRKEKRQLEAKERQAKFDTLTPYERARRRGWSIDDLKMIGEKVVT